MKNNNRKGKPNAAQITKALALLGGGSKAEGGEGMLKGIQNIFLTGVSIGYSESGSFNEISGIPSLEDLEK